MTSSNAGGAITHGGVEYQDRVSGWFAAAMLARIDVAFVFEIESPFIIETLAFETASSIDDLTVRSVDSRVFLQMKRSLSLSTDKDSEFGKTIHQFVTAFLNSKDAREWYVLIVSPLASRTIQHVLAQLLLMVRLNPRGWSDNPLNEEQTDTLAKYRKTVEAAFQELAGRLPTDEEVIKLSTRTRVLTMAVETGGADERNAILMLQSLSKGVGTSEKTWEAVVTQCLRFGKGRLSCTREPLERLVFHQNGITQDAQRDSEDSSDFGVGVQGPLAAGREVVLGELELAELEGTPDKLVVFELIRFNPDGSRRSRFTAETCTMLNGVKVKMHRRSATMKGIIRYIEKNQETYKKRKLGVAPINDENDPDASPIAEAHGLKIAQMLQEQERKLRCLVCDSAVGKDGEIVEIDQEDTPLQAGVVHSSCSRPAFRVLGTLSSPLFEEHPALANFDVQLWVEQWQRGQGLLKSMQDRIKPGTTVAWNPNSRRDELGFCIRFKTADGGIEYCTERARVQRFRKAEAEKAAADFNSFFAKAKERGDPICITKTGIFGQLSKVANEPYSQIELADVVPFTREIGRIYSLFDNYYAPLCVLRLLPDEEDFCLNDHVCLLSDPLLIDQHLKNWRDGGISLTQLRVDILPDDNAVDAFLRAAFAMGRAAILDPKIDLKGNFIAGVPIFPMTH